MGSGFAWGLARAGDLPHKHKGTQPHYMSTRTSPRVPPPHGFGKETHTRNKPTQPYICNITCVREARVVESARANEPGDGAGDDTVPDAEPG